MRFNTVTVEGLDIFYREAGDAAGAQAGPAARLPGVVAPVPQPDPGAGRALSRHRARLPGLRKLRRPRPARVRVHVRPTLRDHRGVPGQGRVHALRAVRAGLRRTGRLPHRDPAARVAGVVDRPEQQRLRGRLHRRLGRAAPRATGSSARRRREQPLEAFLEPATIKQIYLHGHKRPELISPDNWNMDAALLARPNQRRIQLDLFYDYRTNVARYAEWQELPRSSASPRR